MLPLAQRGHHRLPLCQRWGSSKSRIQGDPHPVFPQQLLWHFSLSSGARLCPCSCWQAWELDPWFGPQAQLGKALKWTFTGLKLPVPKITAFPSGEASRVTVPSTSPEERQMDRAGGKKDDEDDEGSASNREWVLRASPALPLTHLPPASRQFPSCLISSPCSQRRPAGASGQGQTKASLLTASPRKGLFFSPSLFFSSPSPPSWAGATGSLALGLVGMEGADGSQAAGAAGPAAASSREQMPGQQGGGLTGVGGHPHSRAASGGFLPGSAPHVPA